MRHIIYIIGLLFVPFTMLAQTNRVTDSSIHTLQQKYKGEWGEPPVLLLGSGDWMEFSFDDFNTEFERYTYRIIHCNADWQQSELLESQYLDGFNDRRIEDYEPSMNTTMSYSHYEFAIPNDEQRIKVAGNYRVLIYRDGEDEPAAETWFCAVEPHVLVTAEVSANTDIDSWQTHQQVNFNVNYSAYDVKNPAGDFIPIVMQNRRWDNHVEALHPTYMRNNELIFNHNQRLIFDAGAEYRRFEILDDNVPTMNVFSMSFHRPYVHATLNEDVPRRHYLYDQDQNGRYWIRNGDDEDNDTRSDYFFTHFRLVMPQLPDGSIYLNGDLTNGELTDAYRMVYDFTSHSYELVLPLKQGSYNYQYLFVPDGKTRGTTAPTEGNYHQTENEYWIFIYHRPFGERYDKLVGFHKTQYKE